MVDIENNCYHLEVEDSIIDLRGYGLAKIISYKIHLLLIINSHYDEYEKVYSFYQTIAQKCIFGSIKFKNCIGQQYMENFITFTMPVF